MDCLIVEKDDFVLLTYKRAMDAIGYTCLETDRVAQARYWMKTRQFDVVLMDLSASDGVTLPLVDQIDLAAMDTTIIVITGSGAFSHGEHTTLAPRVDYVLSKPVNVADLQALIEYRRAAVA